MPFSLLPLIFILLAGGIVVWLVVRKFPELANLNVEELPEEKQARKKKEILENKVSRFFLSKLGGLAGHAEPLFTAGKKIQTSFRKKVAQTQRLLLQREALEKKSAGGKGDSQTPAERADRVERLLADADTLAEEGRLSDAESTFLEVIKLDSHNVAAYRGLGKVYMKNGALDEAEGTFLFLLQLTPDDDTLLVKLGKTAVLKGDYAKAAEYYAKAITMNDAVPVRHFEIAEIYKELTSFDQAAEHYAKAVEFEPTNPRYLDGLLTISILLKDKKGAEEVYNRLRLVNPENKKLDEFKHQIEEL
jgi:Flp pilus assembly protein TadD